MWCPFYYLPLVGLFGNASFYGEEVVGLDHNARDLSAIFGICNSNISDATSRSTDYTLSFSFIIFGIGNLSFASIILDYVAYSCCCSSQLIVRVQNNLNIGNQSIVCFQFIKSVTCLFAEREVRTLS